MIVVNTQMPNKMRGWRRMMDGTLLRTSSLMAPSISTGHDHLTEYPKFRSGMPNDSSKSTTIQIGTKKLEIPIPMCKRKSGHFIGK